MTGFYKYYCVLSNSHDDLCEIVSCVAPCTIGAEIAVMNIVPLMAIAAFRRFILRLLALFVASRADQSLMFSGERKARFGVVIE